MVIQGQGSYQADHPGKSGCLRLTFTVRKMTTVRQKWRPKEKKTNLPEESRGESRITEVVSQELVRSTGHIKDPTCITVGSTGANPL